MNRGSIGEVRAQPETEPGTAFFPADSATSVDPETEIFFSLGSIRYNSLIRARIEVSTGLNNIAGKTSISPSEIRFVPDHPLLPLSNYNVRVKFVVRIAHDDSLIKDPLTRPLFQDTGYIDFSWQFQTEKLFTYSMYQASDSVTLFKRDGNKVMQMGDYLYSYGGWTDFPLESHSDIYRSSGDLKHWEHLGDAPWAGRHTFGIGKFDSTLCIFGGDHLSEVFDVWKTVDGSNFSRVSRDKTSVLGPRFLYGACIHNSKFYVLGGQSQFEGGSALTDVWRSYNGRAWEQIATDLDFLGQNISGSVISFNGRIWVIGGGYYTNEASTRAYSNEIYSSKDGANWQREPDGPWTGRQYTDLCVWNNRIWMIAGYNGANLSDIWYMTTSGKWHQLETPDGFEARHATGVGVYKDKLAIVCGNYHNDCWVIEKQ